MAGVADVLVKRPSARAEGSREVVVLSAGRLTEAYEGKEATVLEESLRHGLLSQADCCEGE